MNQNRPSEIVARDKINTARLFPNQMASIVSKASKKRVVIMVAKIYALAVSVALGDLQVDADLRLIIKPIEVARFLCDLKNMNHSRIEY